MSVKAGGEHDFAERVISEKDFPVLLLHVDRQLKLGLLEISISRPHVTIYISRLCTGTCLLKLHPKITHFAAFWVQ